jgi:hypothetical protein
MIKKMLCFLCLCVSIVRAMRSSIVVRELFHLPMYTGQVGGPERLHCAVAELYQAHTVGIGVWQIQGVMRVDGMGGLGRYTTEHGEIHSSISPAAVAWVNGSGQLGFLDRVGIR